MFVSEHLASRFSAKADHRLGIVTGTNDFSKAVLKSLLRFPYVAKNNVCMILVRWWVPILETCPALRTWDLNSMASVLVIFDFFRDFTIGDEVTPVDTLNSVKAEPIKPLKLS